ncbi:MAG: Crp/Fnr family transcriptional regulator [Gammaproteobacteria bacterium]|nr:Crp/Fnr family transcriptional regulator [Gammaproteobacteria bacterium]
MHEDLLVIRKAALFANLLPEDLRQLLKNAHVRRFKAHEQIFAAGAQATAFYFLISGSVRLFRLSPQGDEKVIELVMPDATFGEGVVFLGGRYPVHAAAVTDSEVVELATHHFSSVLASNHDMALRMLAGLSTRLHQLIQDVASLTLETAGQRVAGYLLSQCSPASGDAAIHMVIPKNVVASRIGVKAETFSRVLATLRNLDLIRVTGNDIHVLDRDALMHWRDDVGRT